MQKIHQKGFTLLEIVLVVTLIAILAGIVIIAINPSKQLADSRNTQRKADVNTILNAVYQYAIDNNGALPASVPNIASCSSSVTTISKNEICKTGGLCVGLVDLSSLTNNGRYIAFLPYDPKSSTTNGTGYLICKDGVTNRVTVAAKNSENDIIISATK